MRTRGMLVDFGANGDLTSSFGHGDGGVGDLESGPV